MPQLAPNPSLRFSDKLQHFLSEVIDFDEFGTSTQVFTKHIEGTETPFFVNEFWTSKQRAAHSLHEISYRACFKPQLPRFFIERFTSVGDTVYDPFMGRGTTPLEAALLGRIALANDINPLSKILCEARFSPPTLDQIAQRLEQVDLSGKFEHHADQLAFFHPDTLNQIETLREYFIQRESLGKLDNTDKWIRMVATNRLTGHSPGFFSVYTLPPNLAVSAERQRKINAKREQIPLPKDVRTIILKKSKSLLSKLSSKDLEKLASNTNSHTFYNCEAGETSAIKANSVNLVVTSPPFLDVVDYQSDNWLRCWFNGIDSKKIPISQLKSTDVWINKMTQVLIELKRVLKPQGVIAFEVGEVKGGKLLLEELVIKAALQAQLRPQAVLINDQQFTKTANCWGVDNQSKGTNTNRIVIIQK